MYKVQSKHLTLTLTTKKFSLNFVSFVNLYYVYNNDLDIGI